MARVLNNLMESIVDQRLDEMFPSLDCCQCEQCRLDIKAIVLNRMPAKYVVSSKGEIMSRLSSYARQNSVDLTAAILDAARIVRENPLHEI